MKNIFNNNIIFVNDTNIDDKKIDNNLFNIVNSYSEAVSFLNLKVYKNFQVSKIVFIVDKKVFTLYKEELLNLYLIFNKKLITHELLKINDNKDNKQNDLDNLSELQKSSKNVVLKNFILINATEKNKNLKTYEYILSKLIKLKADRNTLIVGVGGGIVTDITGFVGSTYKRGINFGFIPTTLLSMVDASIGGKNGLNFGMYKNIAGNFNSPDFIILNPGFLFTLNKKQIFSGFSEILKYGLITEKKFFYDVFVFLKKIFNNNSNFTEKEFLNLLKENLNKITYFIKHSIEIKLNIVRNDFDDKGIRNLLNFGHTFGHAIEKLSRGKIEHGIAVYIGMIISLIISKYYFKMNFSKDNNEISNDNIQKKDFQNFELIAKNTIFRFNNRIFNNKNINIGNKEYIKNINFNNKEFTREGDKEQEFEIVINGLVSLMDSKKFKYLNLKYLNIDRYWQKLFEIIKNDKKSINELINFIILEEIGKAKVVKFRI